MDEDLLTAIVTALETKGLDRDSYHLNDFVDVNALKRLVESVEGPITVAFDVQEFQVVVTQTTVTVDEQVRGSFED